MGRQGSHPASAASLLPPRAGLGDAIAAILSGSAVGGHLERSERALRGNQSVVAIEEAAGAFYAAIRAVTPPLLNTSNLYNPFRRDLPELGIVHGQLTSSLEAIERWLTPLALGISPRDFARLRTRLPTAIPSALRPGISYACWMGEPVGHDARSLVEEVSWFCLRLWERGVLGPDRLPGFVANVSDHPLLSVATQFFVTGGRPPESGGGLLLVVSNPRVNRVRVSFEHASITGARVIVVDGKNAVHSIEGSGLLVDLGQPSRHHEVFVGGFRIEPAEVGYGGPRNTTVDLIEATSVVATQRVGAVVTVVPKSAAD